MSMFASECTFATLSTSSMRAKKEPAPGFIFVTVGEGKQTTAFAV